MQADTITKPIFESGKIVVATGKVEVIGVNLKPNKIEVSIENKGFIKRAIKLRSELSNLSLETEPSQQRTEDSDKTPRSPLATLKMVADALANMGITLTIAYKGAVVVTIGADASPSLLHLITKTKSVAVNSFVSLLRMIV